MIICMFNINHFCCSGDRIINCFINISEYALPRSPNPCTRFFTIITVLPPVNFIIYHTFNFATEWLHNKAAIPYYRENEHLLRLASKVSIPIFTIIKSNQSDVFSVNTMPPISVQRLDTIIGDLKQIKIYLSKSDKIGQDIIFFNESIMDNSRTNNLILLHG